MKPCLYRHPQPQPDDCRFCWLAIHDVRYRVKWGIDPAPPNNTLQSNSVKVDVSAISKYHRVNKHKCIHLGTIEIRKETVGCGSCSVYPCAVHGECVLALSRTGLKECMNCNDYKASIKMIHQIVDTDNSIAEAQTKSKTSVNNDNPNSKSIVWAYGLTTVLERRKSGILQQTLQSLALGGFQNPHLFVDGDDDYQSWRSEFPDSQLTLRYPTIRTAANWTLSLYELYIRNPSADRYAMFQDDFVTYRNLRNYLEECEYPSDGYWNLYTFPCNQALAPKDDSPERKGMQKIGWYKSDQRGQGAVALVFDRKTVVALLSSKHLTERPQCPKRGHRAIDGGIVVALAKIKPSPIFEYVHNPSLVQHIGQISSMGSKQHPLAMSFKGQEFNALNLLHNRS